MTETDSRDRITSPEKLDTYLQVTKPSMWIVLGAVLIIVIVFFIWSSITQLQTKVQGFGTVANGRMICEIDKASSKMLEKGQPIWIEGEKSKVDTISQVGEEYYVEADSKKKNGIYEVTIVVENISPLRFLFN